MIKHRRTRKSASLVRSRGASLARLPELVNKAVDVAKDVVNIGKNTRDIINEIKSRPPVPAVAPRVATEIEDIVDRINRIRWGSGFAYA